MAQTLGRLLLNEVLPDGHKVDAELNKSGLTKKLTALAREDRGLYVQTVARLKTLGDEIATLEGTSVGLDDIEPHYRTRDPIIAEAAAALKKATTTGEKEAAILRAQERIMADTKAHPGSMTQMALTGARGNIPQLMKTVATPVAAADAKGKLEPFLISKSYSEGLTAGQYWITGNEARINTVKSTTSVSEPGDVAKVFVNTLYPYVVTTDDCGTSNGLPLPTANNAVIGRYLARDAGAFKRNTAITPAALAKLRPSHTTLTVRSPMTCEQTAGVCRKCQGLDENLQPHPIGMNVGVRAAQALSEPLTQMTLNAKHGVRVLKGSSPKMEGLAGIRQLLEVPQSFMHKAALAEKAGTVTRVQAAPHGGTYIDVDKIQHYAGPGLAPKVKVGDRVEAGDVLSEGVPKPDEVVKHKGIGVGRSYLVDVLHDTYGSGNVTLDRRHLELLARANVGHVKVLESRGSSFLKGDVVPYHQYRTLLQRNAQELPIDRAAGHVLAEDHGSHTVGTELTPSVIAALKQSTVTKVRVAQNPPHVEFIVKPVTRTPLLDPDWMARLSHRYLKESLLKGAHTGATSDLHGTHPVPAYAHGAEFGDGFDGRY